jgi:hypothetical protein
MAGSRYLGTLALLRRKSRPKSSANVMMPTATRSAVNSRSTPTTTSWQRTFAILRSTYAATGPWSQPGPTSALGKIEQKIITDFDGGGAAKNVVGGAGNDSFLGSNQADTLNGVGGASAATTC